jgi:hypothetical protein
VAHLHEKVFLYAQQKRDARQNREQLETLLAPVGG